MKNDIELLEEAYQLILEKDIKRTGPKIVNREDISNFLFKNTDGGREVCTIWTVRKNDSKTDASKKAGMPMIITGRLGACKATIQASTYNVPVLSTKIQYKKNAILRMCVTAVDGKSYTSNPSKDNTRSFDVKNISKIQAGREIYDVI